MTNVINPEGIFSSESDETAHSDQTVYGAALRNVDNAILRTNEAVQHAVEAGISVELLRHSRHHNGHGHWGDQIARKHPG